MYIENNNKHLTKKHNICIGSHEKQLLLFSLVHLILCYIVQ